MQKTSLYRSIKEPTENDQLIFQYRDTMRAPSNVPYIVDNLWEWARPDGYPCRRHASYASPTPKLALESGPGGGKAYQVRFLGQISIAQVKGCSDSKEHPDCKKLKKVTIHLLRQQIDDWWLDWDIGIKQQLGQLWMPCLRKSEMDYLFAHVPELNKIHRELRSYITYWNDIEIINPNQGGFPDKDGEIFFEARDGYQLMPIIS